MPAPDATSTPRAARSPAPALLLGLLALWLLVTLGVRPLLVPDEGRYAEVARAMVQGDLLVPTLNGLPFFHAPPRVDLRWLVSGWVLCALAMLAKGLIGIVLPAMVIGPWLLAQGRWRQVIGLLHPLALLAFAIVGAPWFVAMQLRYPEFFDYF